MPEHESQDFQETLLLVQEYLEEIGYEDLETTESDEGDVYHIEIVNETESIIFRIEAKPEEKRFVVLFAYQLSADLANQLGEDHAEELVDAEDILEDETQEQRAAKNIINSLSKDDNEEILFRLTEAGTDVYHDVITTNRGNIDGFYLFDNVFPYEDDFSVSDLNSTIRRVTSRGELSMKFLQYAFGIEIGDSENGNDDDQTLLDLRIP